MNAIKCNTNKIIKYIMVAIIIYAILKVIPINQRINNSDTLLLLLVILVSIIFLDNINLRESFADTTTTDTTSPVTPVSTNIDNLVTSSEPIQPPPPMPEIAIDFIPPTETTMCDVELEKIRKDFEKQLTDLKNELSVKSLTVNENVGPKYYSFLVNDLLEKGIIDSNDVKNINAKLNSKLLTMNDVITSLEQLKKDGVVKSKGKLNDFAYSELPTEFYSPIGDKIANQWDNDYNILDTNRWQVPMHRPPVCINSEPCKICPLESSPGIASLKDWDNSRKVTEIKVNKQWANSM